MPHKSGISSFQRDAKEFLLDVHSVTRNFVLYDVRRITKNGDRFIDAMAEGTRNVNDRTMEERIRIGVFAAFYTIPYTLGRIVVDGVLNTFQYAEWRLTTRRKFSELQPQKRKINAYVLGAPLSIPFILGMGVLETALRALGISEYSGHIIRSAAMRAANMSKYTKTLFRGPYDPKTDHDAVMTLPKNGRELADRVGLITIPGLIAALSIGFAAAITAVCFVGEHLYPAARFAADHLRRALGLSTYGVTIIKHAFQRSANLSKYTRFVFRVGGLKDARDAYLNREAKKDLFSKPDEGWTSKSIADRFGFVTLPGVISAIGVSVGLAITIIGYTGQIIRRTLGITDYGLHIIQAAWKRAANIFYFYNDKRDPSKKPQYPKYDQQLIARDEDIIFSFPKLKIKKNPLKLLNYAAFITIPGVIAAAEITIVIGIVGIRAVFDVLKHSLGLTEYGKSIVKAATIRAAKMSSYTKKIFPKKYSELPSQGEGSEHSKVLKKPTNGWEKLDRVSFVTFPGLIAAGFMFVGAAITAIGFIGEYTGRIGRVVVEHIGRALGFSAVGDNVIKLAGMRAANMSFYTRALFRIKNIEQDQTERKAWIKEQQKTLFHPEKGWNSKSVADHIGIFTGAGLIAALEVGFCAAVSAVGFAGEAFLRFFGFSTYGKSILKAAVVRAQYMSSYTKKLFKINIDEKLFTGKNSPQAAVLKWPKNGWGVIDRFGLITLPGITAAFVMGFGAVATMIGFVWEHIKPVLGFSKIGRTIIDLAALQMVMMSKYTLRLFGYYKVPNQEIQDLIKRKREKLRLPKGWKSKDIADRIALVTFPGILAAGFMFIGGAVTAIGFTAEFLRHALGITDYGLDVIKAAAKRALNISRRYTRKSYSKRSILENQNTVFSLPDMSSWDNIKKNAWEILDRAALFTIPGLIALATVSLAGVFTAIAATIETVGRTIGISKRSFYGMVVTGVKCANMLGFSDLKNTDAVDGLKAPVQTWWDAFDCVGTGFTGMLTGIAATTVILPLAIIGISKSNYHRLNYYKNRIHNAIRAREGKSVNNTAETYHKNKLKECAETKSGKFFSKVNALNILGQLLYYTARYIAAPLLYVAVKCVTQLFGLIPLIKVIHRATHPIHYDLNKQEDRIKKRLADLTLSLDKNGLLPISDNTSETNVSDEITKAVKEAEGRSFFKRAGFSLFAEGRRVISLGYARDEKIIAVFKNKFEEFMRIKERAARKGNAIDVQSFFACETDSNKNENSFSYENIVKYIKNSFSHEMHAEIDQIAALLKDDLTKARDNTPQFN